MLIICCHKINVLCRDLCEIYWQLHFLLECLGFGINSQKNILEPTQLLVFLSLTINSADMELWLPPDSGRSQKVEIIFSTQLWMFIHWFLGNLQCTNKMLCYSISSSQKRNIGWLHFSTIQCVLNSKIARLCQQ